MTIGQISVTEGTGKTIATYEFTDLDSTVKELQRIVLSTSAGLEITDGNNNIPTHEQYNPLYEDNNVGVAVVEFRYSPTTELNCTQNTIIQAVPGYVDHVSVSADNQGQVTAFLRDSTSSGSGTIIKTIYVVSDGVHSQNFDVPIRCQFTTGIEMDFSGLQGNVRIQVFRR